MEDRSGADLYLVIAREMLGRLFRRKLGDVDAEQPGLHSGVGKRLIQKRRIIPFPAARIEHGRRRKPVQFLRRFPTERVRHRTVKALFQKSAARKHHLLIISGDLSVLSAGKEKIDITAARPVE